MFMRIQKFFTTYSQYYKLLKNSYRNGSKVWQSIVFAIQFISHYISKFYIIANIRSTKLTNKLEKSEILATELLFTDFQ